MPTTQLSPQEERAKLWAEADAADSGAARPELHNDVDQAAPTGQSAETKETAADAAVEAKASADPYSGVPDYIREELQGLKSMLSQTTQRLRNAEGHIGGLRSQILQTAQRAPAEPGQPSAGEIRAAQGDKKLMAKLLEDYPEFGGAVSGALKEEIEALRSEMRQARPEQLQGVVTGDQLQAMRKELLVESKHPGWQEEVTTPAFKGWLGAQQREVQMLAESDDPRDAIRLLDLRAEAVRNRGSQQQQRLESASLIPSGRRLPPGARERSTESMTKAEYWAHLDAIEKQGV